MRDFVCELTRADLVSTVPRPRLVREHVIVSRLSVRKQVLLHSYTMSTNRLVCMSILKLSVILIPPSPVGGEGRGARANEVRIVFRHVN